MNGWERPHKQDWARRMYRDEPGDDPDATQRLHPRWRRSWSILKWTAFGLLAAFVAVWGFFGARGGCL